MKFYDELKGNVRTWLLSQFRVGGTSIELPNAGRSSIEKVNSKISLNLGLYEGVSPYFNVEHLALLKFLWLYNSDMSQYAANIVNLGNNGHSLQVDAKTDSTVEAAINRLNQAAANLYPNAAGIDGFINQALTDICVFGALSSEDVVDLRGRQVKKIVVVPVEDIRFVYNRENDEFVPHQKVSTLDAPKTNGLLPLHPATYRYYSLIRYGSSPYGKPPALAALEAITTMQTDALSNVKHVAKKFGLLGIILASVMPPRQRVGGTETESEYNSRATSYLKLVRDRLEEAMAKGLVAHYHDQKISVEPGSANAKGFYEVFRVIEEQVMSGLGMQPAFFGRTDSTTETYADVVYNLLLSQVGNMQRLVKRRLEATYRLDLRLGGIEVDGISLFFNKAPARNMLQDAQAEQVKVQTVLEKAKHGIISPDQAAQELGYDTAFDANILLPDALTQSNSARSSQTINLRFDRRLQKYVYQPEQILLSGSLKTNGETSGGNVVYLAQKN